MNGRFSSTDPASTRSRFLGTWSLGRPRSSVKIDMSAKGEIQELVYSFFAHPNGLPKEQLEDLLSRTWPPEKWNLLSVVLQTLCEDHPSVPDILRHIEALGAFPWKPDPS